MEGSMEAVVLGNVTMDILCYPVEHVPRHESITFKHSIVSPGGCGSNVAIGLCALGVKTALIGRIGTDVSAVLITPTWDRVGLNYSYVKRDSHLQTGISVGLVDLQHQPRFIHTSGANQLLTAEDLRIEEFAQRGTRAIHVAGYFVLPGLMDDGIQSPLCKARAHGITTSLDVVSSPNMDNPEKLWQVMPCLDFFLCNAQEAKCLTGENEHIASAKRLLAYGAQVVIVKLGALGCWVESKDVSMLVPGISVDVVDTTGAGDAFAAGLIAAILQGADLEMACKAANQAGARVAADYGCISAWLK
jgi:sugar/nucleoside kinase (ribokinase family)